MHKGTSWFKRKESLTQMKSDLQTDVLRGPSAIEVRICYLVDINVWRDQLNLDDPTKERTNHTLVDI
jgi:hypothetical protein